MFKRAAIAFLLLSACAPETKAPETRKPEQQTVAPPATATPPVTPPATTEPVEKILPTVTKAPMPGDIKVKGPAKNARVTSPLVAEGTAINNWFFEGQFAAELIVDGEVIGQAPAMQAGAKNWTSKGQIGFKVEMPFEVTKETNAELVLSEDMPAPIKSDSDEPGPARAVRIPVVLLPKAQ